MVIGEPDPNVQYDPLRTPSGNRIAVRQYTIEASGEVVRDTIKRAKTGRWELVCDEGPRLGGLDIAPAPLQYFAASVLF